MIILMTTVFELSILLPGFFRSPRPLAIPIAGYECIFPGSIAISEEA